MNTAEDAQRALREIAKPERVENTLRFFKAYPGGYSEGDKFLGCTVPATRLVAKQFYDLPLTELDMLIKSPWHDDRLLALIVLVRQYTRGDGAAQQAANDFYMDHTANVNNWDLVDTSSEFIVGPYLEHRPEKMAVLTRLASSDDLWERRIAMIATFDYIRKGRADEALVIAERLLHDKHDLIQKAVGWMLREIGKRVHDGRCPARRASLRPPVRTHGTRGTAPLRASAAPCAASPDNGLKCGKRLLTGFLDKHAAVMPRTTLRYAIEHLPPEQRAHYMGLKGVK